MAFPTNPTNNQITIQNGIRYTYASSTRSWKRAPVTTPALNVYIDSFIGDGSTVSYTLSVTPSGKDYVSINIDGISQLKSAYALNNNIVTFTGIPDVNSVIEVKTWSSSTVGVLTGLVFDTFTGDGTTRLYTLGTSPTNVNYTLVSVNGVVQKKTTYSLNGNKLTFTVAPANSSSIEITTFGPAITSAPAVGNDTQIQFNNNGTLAGTNLLTIDTANSMVTSNNLTVTGNLSITTANLTNINISNASSQVPNALVASTIYTNAQPNITSLGTLTSLTVQGFTTLAQTTETCVLKNGAAGVVVHDVSTSGTFYHASIAANFTANFTNVPITNNRITVVSLILIQGPTIYIPSLVQINGITQTVKWIGNTPFTGNANKIEVVSYSLIRTADTWVVIGQYSAYG